MSFLGVMQLCVNRFGSYLHGLAGLGLEDGKGEGFVLVKEGDFPSGLLADRDFGIVEGIAGPLGLDLVGCAVILQGQVFGQCTGLLVAQDLLQIVIGQQRAMRVVAAAGRSGETPVEVLSKGLQVGIRGWTV